MHDPFCVVQQGQTVRLNTGCIASQKINLLYSVVEQAPFTECHFTLGSKKTLYWRLQLIDQEGASSQETRLCVCLVRNYMFLSCPLCFRQFQQNLPNPVCIECREVHMFNHHYLKTWDVKASFILNSAVVELLEETFLFVDFP